MFILSLLQSNHSLVEIIINFDSQTSKSISPELLIKQGLTSDQHLVQAEHQHSHQQERLKQSQTSNTGPQHLSSQQGGHAQSHTCSKHHEHNILNNGYRSEDVDKDEHEEETAHLGGAVNNVLDCPSKSGKEGRKIKVAACRISLSAVVVCTPASVLGVPPVLL